LNKFAKEVNRLIFNSHKKCVALNKSVFDIEGRYDLVYLDPPYLGKSGSSETANYLKCYHFLEGLSKYDKWKELVDKNTFNLVFLENKDNEFSSEIIFETYEKMFHKFKNSIIILSYKKGGKPSISYLVALMKRFRKNVYTFSKNYCYALNNQNGNKILNREVLIIGL